MPFPTTKVEISFVSGPYERIGVAWTDVTTYVRNLSIRRGRSTDLEQFPTSTASVILDNRDRRFDPFNTAGPYYGQLTPRRQIRVTANTGSGFVPVWRGWVSGWPIEYTNAGHDATTSLECFDILGLIAEEQTLSDAPAYFGYDYYRYRLNEPAGETTLLSGQVPGSIKLPMTQVAGTSSYTTFDPLAPGFPYSSIRIGRGNTWRAAERQTPGFSFTQGGDFAFWMANEAPGVQLQAVRLSALNDYYVTILASGAIQVDQYDGAARTTVTSSTTPFANFAPHHVQISGGLFGPGGVPSFDNEIYVDGVNVSGARSSAGSGYPAPPLGYGAFELSNHIFQDVMFFGRSLSGFPGSRTPTQAAANARQIYGSAVNNAPETSTNKALRVINRSALPTVWCSLATNPESTLGTQGAGLTLFNELQKISESEGGEMFANKDGILTMTNRSYAAANGAGTAVTTFADDGTGLPYGPQLGININADELLNRLNVTFSGGGEITNEIPASITAYGMRESSVETYIATKQGAVDYAAHEVGTFSQPIPQFSALEVSVTQTLAQWATILGLELLDKITLKLTPKTGAPITQPLIINSITHDITPGQWTTTVQGSARYIGWFVIGRSLIGGPDLLV
jgi:hypothetical protein